jgi:hypothetical protein
MYITWVITAAFDSLYHVYSGSAASTTADAATDVAAVQQLVWTGIFQLWDSGTKIGVLALGASCLEVYIPGTVQRFLTVFKCFYSFSLNQCRNETAYLQQLRWLQCS